MTMVLKRMMAGMLIICMMAFTGCGAVAEAEAKAASEGENGSVTSDNVDNMTGETEALEVTFLNYYPCMLLDAMVMFHNNFFSAYTAEDDPEMLYAFAVNFDNYNDGTSRIPEDYPKEEDYEEYEKYCLDVIQYETAKAVELMEKAGLIVLPDYPYCYYNQNEILTGDERDVERPLIGLCAVVGTLDDVKRVFDETESLEGWYCYVWPAPRPDLVEKIKEAGYEIDQDTFCKYDGRHDFYKSIFGEENQVSMSVKVR